MSRVTFHPAVPTPPWSLSHAPLPAGLFSSAHGPTSMLGQRPHSGCTISVQRSPSSCPQIQPGTHLPHVSLGGEDNGFQAIVGVGHVLLLDYGHEPRKHLGIGELRVAEDSAPGLDGLCAGQEGEAHGRARCGLSVLKSQEAAAWSHGPARPHHSVPHRH